MRAAGSIALACAAAGGRTRLRTIRCEGLSRTSRAFAGPRGAIRLMLSTLGPGVIAGDRYDLEGRLEPGAALTAFGQMATPVFAGDAPSETAARWHAAAGATLVLAPEPLVLAPGSVHAARTVLDLDGDAVAIVADAFALGAGAHFGQRTSASIDGTLAYRDAFELAGTSAGAYGTVTLIAADGALRASFAACVDAAAAPGTARVGVGETAAAIVVRVTAARLWDVRCATAAILTAWRDAEPPRPNPAEPRAIMGL